MISLNVSIVSLNILTNFRWDTIIGTSVTTMRKLPLVFRSTWEKEENEVGEIFRKHNKLILDSVTINSSKLYNALSKVGRDVRHLELDEVSVRHSSFIDIIRLMENLETLTISESTLELNIEDLQTQEPPLNVHHLKTLVMNRSDWKVLSLFYHLRVKDLKIISKTFDETDRIPIETFLLHQSELIALTIYVLQGDFFRSLTRFENVGYPFKLKKLCVDYKYWGSDPLIDDCFIAFLKSHNTRSS